MKRFLKFCGILLILSLLLLPSAVFADNIESNNLVVLPSTVEVGKVFLLHGEFSPVIGDYFLRAYISPDNIALDSPISSATSYTDLGDIVVNHTSSIINATLTVPMFLDDGAVRTMVESGTYYIYLTTIQYGGPFGYTIEGNVFAKTSFIAILIQSPAIKKLTPDEAMGGDLITITGSNFPPNTPISLKMHYYNISIAQGDSITREDGSFVSVFNVPTFIAPGKYDLIVTAGTEVSVTMVVLQDPIVNLSITPTSARAGTQVVVNGSSFPPNAPLTFYFSGAVVTVISGETQTDNAGAFTSAIQIPKYTRQGNYTIEAQAGWRLGQCNFFVMPSEIVTSTTTVTRTVISTETPTEPAIPFTFSGWIYWVIGVVAVVFWIFVFWKLSRKTTKSGKSK